MLVNKCRCLLFYLFSLEQTIRQVRYMFKKEKSNICHLFVWLYGLSLLFVSLENYLFVENIIWC